MRARVKGDTSPFDDVYGIVIGRGLNAKHIPINNVEFEQENKPISNCVKDHWQEVKERAAIAAMQGITSNSYIVRDMGSNKVLNSIAATAICLADALVEQLRK